MFKQMVYRYIFLVPVFCGLMIQILKVLLYAVVDKKVNIGRFVQTSGMPNLHSAVFTSLSTGIGIKYGYSSLLFSLVTTYSAIIVYDTLRLKGEKEKQVGVLNRIISSMEPGGAFAGDRTLRVLHYRPLDVACGVVLGIFGAFVLL